MFLLLLLLAFVLPPPPLPPKNKLDHTPYVKGVLVNQLGNQMFQVAAVLSHAWDNGAVPIFPELVNDTKEHWWKFSTNYRYVFWRLNTQAPRRKIAFRHKYEGLPYQEIPFEPDMEVSGYFQSEKFFAHHKDEILKLFQPHEILLNYIEKHFPWLEKENTVSVHLRFYTPSDGLHLLPNLPATWYEKAMLSFPDDHLFVVFSNNIPRAKQTLAHIPRRMVFMEGQPHFIDLFAMSMCKHNIIANSSFSWWGAYMNQNPSKIVIGPKRWFTKQSGLDSSDILPSDWIVQ